MSKKFVLLSLIVAFCLCGSAQAVTWLWTNAAGDQKWTNGGNWDIGSGSPTSAIDLSWKLTSLTQLPPTLVETGDAAEGKLCLVGSNTGFYGHLIITGGTCTASRLVVGHYGTGVVDCNSVLTETVGAMTIGTYAAGTGTLNVAADAVVTPKTNLVVGAAGKGTLNISGNATINATGGDLQIASNGGQGTVNMSGGTINTKNVVVGMTNVAGKAVMNMTGGTVNASVALKIPQTAGINATVNLQGGVINAPTLSMASGGLLNVAGGTLILNGDVAAAILSNPRIVAYSGYGTLNAVYDGSAYTTVTATPQTEPLSLAPTGPDVNPASNLSWVSMPGATSTTVYFGTSEALVNAGDASVAYTGVTSPFDVVSGNMSTGTTYYWRVVDLVDGTPVSSSTVSFTTWLIYPEATQLSPVGTNVPVTAVLNWVPGCYATQSRVYFGTDEAAVTARSSDPNFYRGVQTPPFDPAVAPAELDLYTTYYWVVDTVGDDGQGNTFWPGTVVSFTTVRPTPPATATWDPIDPNNNLKWDALANWSTGRLGAGVNSYIGNGDPNNKPAIVSNGYTATEAKYVNIGYGQTGKVRVEAGSKLQTAAGGEIRVGYTADGYLEVDGGTVIGDQWVEAGEAAGTHGTVLITNGGTVTTAVYDYNKYVRGSSDTIVSSGGTLGSARYIYVGGDYIPAGLHTLTINDAASLVTAEMVCIGGRADGIVTVNDGTLRGGTTIGVRVGYYGKGQLIVNGGLVEGRLVIPYSGSVGSGHVQLNGGLINTNQLYVLSPTGTMDIAGGTLKIKGDAVDQVLNAPNITSYNGWGRVVADYDDVLDVTTVTALEPDGSVIDPFESYADANDLKATWTATGSSISLETTNTFAGLKAMAMTYSGSSSEAGKALSLNVSAITTFDAKALTLYFAGSAGNTNLPLSIRLESPAGNASVAYDALTSLDNPDWVEWNIDLADFTGVDLNNVTKIAIVVGDGTTSGSGTLYIDQIHLNPARCVAMYATADINGDCISTLDDFSLMARDWLDSGYAVTPSDPNTNGGLVLHYKLDNSSVTDETGNYNGTPTNAVFTATGGYDGGGYLTLNGSISSHISIPPASLSTVATTGEVSVSVWVRGNISEPVTKRQMLFNAQTASLEGHILAANMPMENNGEILFEAGHITTRDPEWQSFYWGWNDTRWREAPESAYRGSTWNHFVFTKDVAAGVQKMYHNGQLVAVTKAAYAPIVQVGSFIIGNYKPGYTLPYHGDVDDFRVYDRVLTPDEVLYLSGGSAFYQPLISIDADFDVSGDVGMGDLMMMASKWLEVQLWPAP